MSGADDWFDDDESDGVDGAAPSTCRLCGDWPTSPVTRHQVEPVDFAPGRAIDAVWWLCSLCLAFAQEGDVDGLVGRARVDGLDDESTEQVARVLADALHDPDLA